MTGELSFTILTAWKNIFREILEFYKKSKRMPSYQEIMELTGFNSKNAVFKLINRLVNAGFIEKDSQGRIIPKRIFGKTKVLGVVEAGFPSPAEEELLDTMSLDEYLDQQQGSHLHFTGERQFHD